MSSKNFCTECSQLLLDKCNACGQFLRTSNCEEDQKETSKQSLSDEEESEDEYEIQKDGTKRAICGCCNRKLSQCPECEKEYDSEQDPESDTETESETSSEESETTTDATMYGSEQKSDDEFTEESTDEERKH
ncbi:MAG: hypothetical protein FD188_3253 [Ignavibacteria bacterium]|nr:MAG: hypothetical protein FD188_3253 [Ignavibacteria bacterium]